MYFKDIHNPLMAWKESKKMHDEAVSLNATKLTEVEMKRRLGIEKAICLGGRGKLS